MGQGQTEPDKRLIMETRSLATPRSEATAAVREACKDGLLATPSTLPSKRSEATTG
jgi:hypothetical protein